ncbi:hypothetical protein ACLOJK_008466 [Asimina triloba]
MNLILLLVLLSFFTGLNAAPVDNMSEGIEFPDHPSFNTGCQNRTEVPETMMKLHLKHKPTNLGIGEHRNRDVSRIQAFHQRIVEKKNQDTVSRRTEPRRRLVASQVPRRKPGIAEKEGEPAGQLTATLVSGFSLGSVEYLMDVFIGTPPKRFSLILDTGSDLNWIQCLPCHHCFPQLGPQYNPQDSSSYHSISCHDPRCKLVSSPDPPRRCKKDDQTCEYFYWYGDNSNTTGDFSLETFTVNLTTPAGESEFRRVEDVMFGCGHWNRGQFHGTAGLLGLGRGPLSFASQLQSLYGHGFSYCLVDWNSNASVSSKLIFGEHKRLMGHPSLNFTSFVGGKENANAVDTFYYIQIEAIMVGGEKLAIPAKTWSLSPEGLGGMIIDSGATLTYFAAPAYRMIKEAFRKKMERYTLVEYIPMLDACYNVSGVMKVEMPGLTILFGDGAVWNFPVENCFVPMDTDIVCLAISEAPNSLSILGNYQQQNFHIFYDTKNSRLGFAPMKCADV